VWWTDDEGWSGEGNWYRGVLVEVDGETKKHLIAYDDYEHVSLYNSYSRVHVYTLSIEKFPY
jgi:hypothetical protein